nr:DUF6057 family protein [uncultured Draconibacterium sp.]
MKDIKDKYIIRIWNGLFFIALLVFWRFFYVQHLVHMEQMQLFLLSFDYLKEHLAVQGGLAIYLGEFITQFFLNKWMAALLTAGLAVTLSLLVQRIFRKLFNTKYVMLSWIPAILYTFLLFNDLYQLSGLVAVTISVGLLVAYLKIKASRYRIIAGFLVLILSYWLTGGAYFIFLFSVLVIELILSVKENASKTSNAKILLLFGFLIFGFIVPLFFRHFVIIDNLLESYLSTAFYKIRLIFPWPIYAGFAVLPAAIFYLGFAHEKLPEKIRKIINLTFSLAAILLFFVGLVVLPNFSKEKEIHYSNLVYNRQWGSIIQLSEEEQPTGEQGKLALSLALAQNGNLSERLFTFSPTPTDFFIPFNLDGMAPLIASEPYYYLGLSNYSKMLALESMESTPDSKMPVRAVKRFAENCIISGQYKVAERYLWYLEQTLFYRRWATNAKQFLYNDEKVNAHPEWGKLRRQLVNDDFYFQYNRMDLSLISLLRSNQQNKMAYEYLMCWYLLRKDFDEFLKYLPLVNNFDYDEMPQAFQEALAYIFTLYDEVPEGLKQFPVSAETQQQLNRYAQAFQQGGSNNPAEMKKLFGNTYWYYVHFTEYEDE